MIALRLFYFVRNRIIMSKDHKTYLKIVRHSIFFSLMTFCQISFGEIKHKTSVDFLADISTADGTLFENNMGTKLYLRRLRIKHSAKFDDKIKTKISLDFNQLSDEITFKDVNLSYKLNKHIAFEIGKFREPFGMEKNQGLSNAIFLERSIATNAFTFGRKIGIKAIAKGDQWKAEAAIMQKKSEDKDFKDSIPFAFRASVTKRKNTKDTVFFHIGFSYSNHPAADDKYDINEPLIAPIFENTFHSPDYLESDVETHAIELATAYNKFIFQSEIYNQSVFEIFDSEFKQSGYYTTLSYPLIGSARKFKHGKLKLTGPQTLEFGVRISGVDTQNFGEGDKSTAYALVINYFKKNLRLSAEYSYAKANKLEETVQKNLTGQALTARIQASY